MLPEWLSFLRWENWGEFLKSSPGWIALLSGLFGAVITAIFNYVINIKLAKREQIRKEQKIAYVFLVKTSQLLSLESCVRQYLVDSPHGKELLQTIQNNKEFFSRPTFPFEICVLIAAALKNNREFNEAIKNYHAFFEMLGKNIDQTLENFEIPPDLLAQFPRDAIVYYQQFLGSILGIKNVISNWQYWLNTGDTKLLSETGLYSNYLTGKLFLEASHNFYEQIRYKAGISTQEAEELLSKQKKGNDRIFKESALAETIMGKISEIYFKRSQEKQHPAEAEKLIKE